MYRLLFSLILLTLLCYNSLFSQEISQFQQFNGRYDYQAFGNTLNIFENNIDQSFCETLPSSQADLLLPNGANIIAVYLYWAGSGSGDTEVTLNGTSFSAVETYTIDYNDPNNGLLTYFSCYAEITNFIELEGNTTYLFEDLDISETLSNNPGYCNNRTNFAGWCVYVIYEFSSFPLNQVNLFQGLEIINRNEQELDITLDNINVLDNEGARIGFLAWEGDSVLSLGETLSINNNIISNPPFNPANNAFNGTNSFTFSSDFYNGDLDVYNIQNNINVGDTSVDIRLTSEADLIILNNVITVLNSELPDATVSVNGVLVECATREIEVFYTISNLNSTDFLPAQTPIAFYANNELISVSETTNDIPINGSESASIILNIPTTIPDNFTLSITVDDIGTGIGIVLELNEINNSTSESIELIATPEITFLEPLNNCNLGFNSALFDLTQQYEFISFNDPSEVSFYESLEELEGLINEIINPETFVNTVNPQTIFIRVETDDCFNIYQFEISVENCPPYIPQVFTPNNDGYNDWFNIQGLYSIFEQHELLIYNRYGTLIFKGNDNTKWEGKANKGLNNTGKLLPTGTYFYVLHLNDPNYKTMTGWVYLNR